MWLIWESKWIGVLTEVFSPSLCLSPSGGWWVIILSYAYVQITYDCVSNMEASSFPSSLDVICMKQQSKLLFVCP